MTISFFKLFPSIYGVVKLMFSEHVFIQTEQTVSKLCQLKGNKKKKTFLWKMFCVDSNYFK